MSKVVGNSLSQNVLDLLNKESTTVIVSTMSDDGYPHALPVHLIAAKDAKTIYLALMKDHKSVRNIRIKGKTFITILDGPDIALGIKGLAKVIKEPMKSNPSMIMMEFKVEEIKSDTTPSVIVLQGVNFVHRTNKTESFFRGIFDELKFSGI